MLRDKIFQLRISSELLELCRAKTVNVSRYIRDLISKDLKLNPDKISEPLVEIRAKSPSVFSAILEKVVDGDTVYLTADLGFYIKALVKVRLMGIDAPPLSSKKGTEAKKFVEEKLTGCRLVVETRKKEKYGRYLAYIYYNPEYTKFEDILRHGKLINEELVNEGLAKEY